VTPLLLSAPPAISPPSRARGSRWKAAFLPSAALAALWSKYDPRMLELDYFLAYPDRSWPILREILYEHFDRARPNKAHEVLARLETEGWPRGPGSIQ